MQLGRSQEQVLQSLKKNKRFGNLTRTWNTKRIWSLIPPLLFWTEASSSKLQNQIRFSPSRYYRNKSALWIKNVRRKKLPASRESFLIRLNGTIVRKTYATPFSLPKATKVLLSDWSKSAQVTITLSMFQKRSGKNKKLPSGKTKEKLIISWRRSKKKTLMVLIPSITSKINKSPGKSKRKNPRSHLPC